MVSLVELSEVTEEGVKFKSPYDGKEILLSPEKSISIQNSLGVQAVKLIKTVSSNSVCNFPLMFPVPKRPYLFFFVFFQAQIS